VQRAGTAVPDSIGPGELVGPAGNARSALYA
jgi:hypothetical protein